jgi:hypothetical protein
MNADEERATAKANAGILRYAQNDKQKVRSRFLSFAQNDEREKQMRGFFAPLRMTNVQGRW